MATGTQTDLLNRIRLLEKSTGTGGGDTGTGTPSDLGAFLLGGQSGGQIAAGGIANTENLTLIPSSDPMATGYVALYGGLSESLRTEQTGITTVSHGVGSELFGAAQLFIHSQYAQTQDQTSNVVGTPLFIQHDVDFAYPHATSSLPGVFGPWTGISYSGTHTWSADALSSFGLTLASYADFLINTNDAGSNRLITPGWSNFSARQYIADGATVTVLPPDAAEGPVAYFDSTTYYTKNSGTLDASTHNIITGSFISDIFIGGNSHFKGRRAFWVKDINQYPLADLTHTVLGGDVFAAVVDTNVGVYVEPLSVGTANLALVVNNPIKGYDALNATYTDAPWTSGSSAFAGAFIGISDTFTLNYTTPDMGAMLQFAGTVNFKQSALSASSFTFAQNQGTFKNDPSVAANLGTVFGFYSNPTFKADSQSVGLTAAKSVVHAPTFTTTGGGVLTVTESTAVDVAGSVAGSTSILSRSGVHVKDATVTAPATVAAQFGIVVDALTSATTNVGIANSSSLNQVGQANFGSTGQTIIATTGAVNAAAGLALQTVALGTKTADFDIVDVANGTALTLNAASINYRGVKIAPTVTMQTAPGIAGTVDTVHLNSTLQGNTGATDTFASGIFASLNVNETIKTQDTNSRSLLVYTAVNSAPVLSIASSGALTIGTLNQFSATAISTGVATITALNGIALTPPTVNASGTVTTYTAVNVANAASASGTFTTCVGVDIAQLTRATTNIGFRNAGSTVYTPVTVTVTANAGTVPVTCSLAKLTNSSAALITVTLATANAVDGQITRVRIYDATNATQTITWINTETGKAGAPPTPTFGSTTIPTTATFAFNGTSSKWTYLGN